MTTQELCDYWFLSPMEVPKVLAMPTPSQEPSEAYKMYQERVRFAQERQLKHEENIKQNLDNIDTDIIRF